jgi:hypothetical protein
MPTWPIGVGDFGIKTAGEVRISRWHVAFSQSMR